MARSFYGSGGDVTTDAGFRPAPRSRVWVWDSLDAQAPLVGIVGVLGTVLEDGTLISDDLCRVHFQGPDGFSGVLYASLSADGERTALAGPLGVGASSGGSGGTQGVPGKSAYEVAVDNGYTGTVTAWLASLVGPAGATGPAGPTGVEMPPWVAVDRATGAVGGFVDPATARDTTGALTSGTALLSKSYGVPGLSVNEVRVFVTTGGSGGTNHLALYSSAGTALVAPTTGTWLNDTSTQVIAVAPFTVPADGIVLAAIMQTGATTAPQLRGVSITTLNLMSPVGSVRRGMQRAGLAALPSTFVVGDWSSATTVAQFVFRNAG